MKKSLRLVLVLLLSVHIGQGQSLQPLKDLVLNGDSTNLEKLLTENQWKSLFPHRFSLDSKNQDRKDFYSYKALIKAIRYFPGFLSDTSQEIQKKELAAFFANIAQETSAGWDDAPDGYFKWGLYFVEEKVHLNYNDTTNKRYQGKKGRQYFGRGPKQLSWNYNYGQFSEAWFGNKDTLLEHPELLSTDPILSFASALWFWMTPQYPKPSCHDIITGKWSPSPNDLAKGRVPGFGATVNVINGGIECGTGIDAEQTKYRYRYYQYFCRYFGVDQGDNINCTNQKPFGQ